MPTGLFSGPRGLWKLCDSAKRAFLRAFRNEPNDYFHVIGLVLVGLWFSFVDHSPREIGSKNVDLHLGSGRPRPPWWRTTMLQPRRFPPARTTVISGREKKSPLDVDIHNDHSLPLPTWQQQQEQGCIFRLTCSHRELTKDHVLTSAYVKIFRTVTRNAVNRSVWRKKRLFLTSLKQTCNEYLISSLRIRAHLSWRTGKHLHVLHVLWTYSTCSYPGY